MGTTMEGDMSDQSGLAGTVGMADNGLSGELSDSEGISGEMSGDQTIVGDIK